MLAPVLAAAATVAWLAAAPAALAESDFGRIFNSQVNGSIVTVGNTVLGCGTNATCAQARARGGANNSAPQVNEDADDDPSTYNSSSARLALPSGAKVLYARLYWMADGPSSGRSEEVKFRAPGSTGYRDVPAVFRDASSNRYVGAAEVTDLVKAAGAGDYWVGNILARTGVDTYAGWAINVAYESADEPLRDLTMFEGFKDVRRGRPVSSTISGFLTPPSGTVQAKIGAIAGEGDRGNTGDALLVNGKPLADAVAPANDFFNSTISALGAENTERTPSNSNTLGFDAKQVAAPEYLPNGATSARVEFTSSGDVYFPVALTTQVDIYAPRLTGQKSVQNLSGGERPKAGDVLEYTVAMDNVGEDAALDARLSDELPPGVSYVPGSLRLARGDGQGPLTDVGGDDRGRYAEGPRRVEVNAGSGGDAGAGGRLGPNEGFAVTFRVTVDREAAGTTLTNTARLGYTAETIGKRYSTERSAAVTVADLADVAITKSVEPAELTAGETARYTLTAVNNGPSAARDVRVRDSVPAGVRVTGTSPSTGRCTDDDGAVDCALGTLGNGERATVTVTVRVDDDHAPGTVTNAAQASTSTADDRPENDTASATAPVGREADLVVTKTAAPANPAPGDPLTYTITVRNAGPSRADGVVLTDDLPAPLLDPRVTGDGCEPPGGTLQCAAGDLRPGARAEYTVRGTIDPDYRGGPIANTAAATSTTPDRDPANDTATVGTPLAAARADLVLSKTAAPAPAVPGSPLTYTVTLRNAGPSSARDVVVEDVLPRGLTGPSADASQGACAIAGRTVRCPAGTVEPGGTVTVTVAGRVAADATGTLTNTATATSSTPDPTPPTAATETPLRPTANLRITKTARPQQVNAGDEVTYTLSVHNAGPSDATGVVVTDDVPAPLRFARATTSSGGCARDGATVRCALGDLPDGGDATVTVVAAVPDDAEPAGIGNEAKVDASSTDPDPSDNTAAHTVRTERAANVRIAKTADRAALVAGERVTYTLRVANDGPSTARDVVVTDAPPDGTTAESARSTRGGCAVRDGRVRCGLGTLGRDGTATITVVALVGADRPAGTLTNTAEVTTRTPETTDSDNAAALVTEVRRAADLTAGKSAEPDSVDAGGEVAFRLTARNAGPSTAQDTVLTDTLPDGLEFVRGRGPAGDCAERGGRITCPAGTIAPGEDAQATITVRVPPGARAGEFTNTVEAFSATPDPKPGDNTAATTVTVRSSAKLSIVKSADPADPVAGTPVTYTLTVRNDGPSTARGATVADDVPAAVREIAAVPSQGTCSSGGQRVECALGDLDPGVTATVRIRGTLDPGASGKIENTATVTSETPNPDPSGTTDTSTGTVTPRADLGMTKEFDPGAVQAGGGMTYLLRAVNQGPSTARDVVLTDALPAGVTAADIEAVNGTCENARQVITCRAAELGVGEVLQVRVLAHVDESFRDDEVTNTAAVRSATPDPAPDNNSAKVTTRVDEAADLSVVKSSTGTVVVPGQPMTYDIRVHNAGPSTARDVTLLDSLPEGMSATEVTVTPAGAGRCALDGRRVTCGFGTIRQGESVVVTINDAVLGPDHTGATATNRATVRAETPDPHPDDNTVELPLPVRASADLAVTKSADPATVVPGQPVTFTIGVANRGPSVARSVTVTDQVDPRLRVTSATGGRCEVRGGRVGCALGDLRASGRATVTITALVPAGFPSGRFRNTATTTSATDDPNPANNTATVTVGSAPLAGVSIRKTAEPRTVAPGRPVTFTLTAANHGPSAARAVTVTDVLDARLRDITATAPGRTCTVTGTRVECALGDLADGATVPITVTALVPAGFGGKGFANQALVTSPTPDPEPDDNVAVAEVGTAPEADLRVTKSAARSVVASGDLAYTVEVANRGPSDAPDVRLVDALPAQVTPKGVQAPPGVTCSEGRRLDCALGTLPAGRAVRLTVNVTVDPSARGPVRNTASAISPVDDPGPGNNTGTAVVTAYGRADLAVTKSASAARARVGSAVTYRVTVRNDGPSTALGVTVADRLPSGVTLLAARAATGTYTGDRWTVGDLPSGDAATLTMTVRLTTPGTKLNTATAPSREDPDPENNTATSRLTATPKPGKGQGNDDDGGGLPFTGTQLALLALLGTGLVAAGLTARTLLTRRRSGEDV
ncbi:DUF7507 domain-containing protein [Spirillospora sp. CA-294931]|uniref:DUF7507 domain-containing protein n=1 Tax=Spirillospora sp. CA-294931 TaxID=3240042 RepID=UPI003D8F39E1